MVLRRRNFERPRRRESAGRFLLKLENYFRMLIHRLLETFRRELREIQNGPLSAFQYYVPYRVLNAVRFVGEHPLGYLPCLEYLAANDTVNGQSANDDLPGEIGNCHVAVLNTERDDVSPAARTLNAVIE